MASRNAITIKLPDPYIIRPDGTVNPEGVQRNFDAIKHAAAASGASSAPSGPAGGDLAGTYPNPTIKTNVALTGDPTAPTAAAADNDTSIATTAFVQNAVSGATQGSIARTFALMGG